MTKRVKPTLNIPAVTTLEEADATLRRSRRGNENLRLLSSD